MKEATPLATLMVVVPEVKVACGAPAAIVIVTEPVFCEVTTLLNWSSTETPTLGMELPAVPGPGVVGVNARCVGAAAFTMSVNGIWFW